MSHRTFKLSRLQKFITVLVLLLFSSQASSQSEGDGIGKKESALSHPKIVTVGELEGIGHIGNCTATLTSQRVVITAAHCFGQPVAANCSGRTNFTLTDVRPVDDPTTPDDESQSRQDVTIGGAVQCHVDYGVAGWARKDLALIVLDRPVFEVAIGVEPILLAGPQHTLNVGELLTLVGYGRTGANCQDGTIGKQQMVLPVSEVVPDAVRFKNTGMHSCPGDSGGPILTSEGWQVGVASWFDSAHSTYRPTSENYAWIASVRDPLEPQAMEGAHVSSGTSSDLDHYRPLYGYMGGVGYIGMGIAGSNDHVYAWYSDGTLSSGTSGDLGKHRQPYNYTLPAGKKPSDIVGMGIAGSNDHVYAWYSDGTVSSGTSGDLGKHRQPYNYTLPAGKKPSDIVGMGIAGSDDHIYAWYQLVLL